MTEVLSGVASLLMFIGAPAFLFYIVVPSSTGAMPTINTAQKGTLLGMEGVKPHSDITVTSITANDQTEVPEKLPATAEEAQQGVRNVEAVTLTWTKTSLVMVFINMWCLYLVNAFQSTITNTLTPYVTSDFEQHSLLTVIYIVSNSMSAAVYIPVAKMLDTWGRAEGFLVMVCLATLGLILNATVTNLPTFCAAQVFYSIGFGGMIYCVDVITADVSSLKHRGLAFAFTASPYTITAFAGPKAVEGFYKNISWRWGFGCFAIILPIVAAPLFLVLKTNLCKAKQDGLVPAEETPKRLVEQLRFFLQEFDALGVILLASGLIVFLLPFTLADSAPSGWHTGYIIAMLITGFILLILFALHERFNSVHPFIPFSLLTNRTIVGTCLLCATYQIAYYCWNSYFISFLQVVTNLTIAQAGYVSNTFDIVSGILLILVGYSISETGYFRWLLFLAVPIYIFAQGLMIYFRKPDMSVAYLVMCQIFIAIGGSIIVLCEQVAVLAATNHQSAASVLALLSMTGWLGGSIGNTVSGAIWTNTFPQALARLLPADTLDSLDDIYGSLDIQLSYEIGTPTRQAIQEAYGIAQQRMLTTGTAVMGLALVWVFLIRNINVTKIQQVKGVVF